ncbi:serine/threonine-protein kinase KIN2 [Phlyctochytrium planicorne]|nr:serine/threonine-protein kinase KIN2 [Phlyctochytrium planicorne]
MDGVDHLDTARRMMAGDNSGLLATGMKDGVHNATGDGNHHHNTTNNTNTNHNHQNNTNSSNQMEISSMEREKPRKYVGKYKLSKTIGQGSLGKVKIAQDTLTGERRACKIMHYRGLTQMPVSAEPLLTSLVGLGAVSTSSNVEAGAPENDKIMERRIIREAATGLILNHPHICQLYEIALMTNYYYFFFEFVEQGQMLDYILAQGALREDVARRFIRQIISAVDYCHQNNIVHRDLKIENILIDAAGNVKLIDFGFSNVYSPSSQLQTFCGSLYFAAPELLRAKSYVGPEVDIWSMGIILYVLVCGRVPFDDESLPALQAKIKRGRLDFPPHLSDACKDLIAHMLAVDPSNRATMEFIKSHPWTIHGYGQPPDNFLPTRHPLTDIDINVVKRMKGFEFGTEDDILLRLRTALAQNPVIDPVVSIYHLVKEKMEKERMMKDDSTIAQFQAMALDGQ